MDISLVDIALVAIGGAIGAIARFTAGQLIDSQQFPWATFTVNIVGSFLLSLLTFAIPGIDHNTKLLLFTGFFGAFTTMSTFSLETVKLFFDGRMVDALLNFVMNAGLCVIGACAGRYAGLIIVG